MCCSDEFACFDACSVSFKLTGGRMGECCDIGKEDNIESCIPEDDGGGFTKLCAGELKAFLGTGNTSNFCDCWRGMTLVKYWDLLVNLFTI